MKIIFILLLCGVAQNTWTQIAHADQTVLAVGAAKTKQAVLSLYPGNNAYGNALLKTIEADFEFLKLFRLIAPADVVDAVEPFAPLFSAEAWLAAKVDYIGTQKITTLPGGKLQMTLTIWQVASQQSIFTKTYLTDSDALKTAAHTLADDIVLAITGKRGIFNTRIAMVCDKSNKKEVYTMAYDGSDVKPVTRLGSLAMAPAWSPNGEKMAFSVYTKHSNGAKNLDLFLHDFKTGKHTPLSNRMGINSGATFHPNGRELAMTLSFAGNPDIYLLNLDSKTAQPLTRSVGFDVDPKFSPDGKKIAFVSSRPGKPMIYIMPIENPGAAKRITFAGQYNATPSWTPDGNRLAFAGWIEKHFDLFVINVNTQQIDRLTKNEGNNEDPSVSPDGNYVVFSSNREAGKNIWLMSLDGSYVKRLSFAQGNCTAPAWSPYL